MILALDIGNSNIKAALFEGLEQKTYFRISCDRNKSCLLYTSRCV